MAAIDALAGRKELAATEMATFRELWPKHIARLDGFNPSDNPPMSRSGSACTTDFVGPDSCAVVRRSRPTFAGQLAFALAPDRLSRR